MYYKDIPGKIGKIPDTAIQLGKLSKIPNIISMTLYDMLVNYGKLNTEAATNMERFFKRMWDDQEKPHDNPIVVGNLSYSDFKTIIDLIGDTDEYSSTNRYFHLVDLFYYD